MVMTKEKVRELFKKNGYYIDDYTLSKAYLSLHYLLNRSSVGQEVYSLCLDGPSGCGKTSFVSAYVKVASELLREKVEFINFQLDAETGKSDLYEDVDVVAAVENDASRIRIPGTILKAIKLINEGHYVILKMDEYDKARDSTDTFFNNFLQEGMINTIQHGNVAIDSKNFGKLQVFLCKNDMRVDLSEPMMRRNRLIRLDYMTPELMFQILQKFSKDHGIADELLNLVALIYQQIYNNRSIYTKLPSCSECQQALMDAFLLLQGDGFSKNDIYTTIIENMLKLKDDVASFESSLQKDRGSKLKSIVDEMKKDTLDYEAGSINSLIAQNVFANESKKITDKVSEMQHLIDEYRQKFADLEKKRSDTIDAELDKIKLSGGKLVSTPHPSGKSLFGDESLYVKRGHDIFELSADDWTDVANLYFPLLIHDYLIGELIKNADKLDVKIYENGILLHDENDIKLIVSYDIDSQGKPYYHVMASQPVIPATYLEDINNFISFANETASNSEVTPKLLAKKAGAENIYLFNALVYNEKPLRLALIDGSDCIDCTCIQENVYNVNGEYDPKFWQILDLCCLKPNESTIISKQMMSNKKKVKVNE